MVTIMDLWMPILLSAVLVFIASSVIHMALGYHHADFARIPNEDAAQSALRQLNLTPADYAMPYASTSAEMKDPAFLARLNSGPNVVMTVLPSGPAGMGGMLAKWFVYLVVVSVFAAYVAGRTLSSAATYLAVFRVTATVAFAGYALAHWQAAIWYRKSVGTTLRNTFDGLIYGLLTGGAFGWLWPG